jgi:hypothetical protein
MFLKCVQIINTNIVATKIQNSWLTPLFKNLYAVIIANEPINEIDAIDEILAILATKPHTTAAIIESIGEIASKIPAAVATPFPPLKHNQTGNTWPIIQHKHGTKSTKAESTVLTLQTDTMAPLATSRINVINANLLSPVLRTFVVPVLPDPNFLRSIPFLNFASKKPDGIEPTKYPTTDSKNRSIRKTLDNRPEQ